MNKQYEIVLEGMSCGHCVAAARDALESVDGVSVDKIWVGKALITTDNFSEREGKIQAALTEEGYPLVSAQAR